jgi:ankyrin repeat protein
MFAAREGRSEVAKLLLSRGANVNALPADGASALLVATVRGHLAVAEVLLDHGADPNTTAAGYSPLHWAVGTWETTHTADYKLESGEWAALLGLGSRKLDFVKTLLAHGADPNIPLKDRLPQLGAGRVPAGPGARPFWLAALSGDADVMRLLVANGANPRLTSNDGTPPLLVAAGMGKQEQTHFIPEARQLEAVKLCLSLGADVRETNRGGNTALHAAAGIGFDTIVQYLIDMGAQVDAKNARGQTPFDLATGVNSSIDLPPRKSTMALLSRAASRAK